MAFFECYCFVKMSAIVAAQRWNLWCFNLRSSWWNLKTSHLRFSLCLYNLPFLFKNHLSLPLRSLPSKESLHCVLSLIQSFSSTLSSTELKIQANASCGERVDTVVGSSATVEISACLPAYCCAVSWRQECWFPRHVTFMQSPAEISGKRYFCSSAAVEHVKGVWSKEGESESVRREGGNEWRENLQEIGGNNQGEEAS